MQPQDTLRRARKRLESLTPERLRVADDFLAYLEERESMEATAELLRIPGFEGAFEKARKEVAEGRVTPLEDLELDD